MANSLTYFVAISASLIAIMFMVDLSMTNVAADEGISVATDFFDYEGSHIQRFDEGNYTLNEDIASQLPSGTGEAGTDSDTGNIFTDTFRAIRGWLLDLPGVKHILGVANALPNFVKLLLPAEYAAISFGIGYLWNTLFVVALIMWLKGGGD